MLHKIKLLSLLLFSFIFVGCGTEVPPDNEKTLRITAIPDENPTELLRKATPLMKYLEKETGLEVEFFPVTDYSAAVEALVNRKVDLAWYGGFTFVQAFQRSGGNVVPIVQREEDSKFRSVFITSDPSIKSLNDLNDVTFSFGSQSSTSGHLMPRTFLQAAGVNPESDFKKIAYSGAHDATVASVGSGKVQAGALNQKVWEKLKNENRVPKGTRVFFTTPNYFDYNWTVHKEVNKETIKNITDAFLKLDNEVESDRVILELQRATKFIPTNVKNYEDIEKAAKEADLLN